ncbi:unnamed protein product [Brassicogethes aeneus]|uniref:Uncharacterized protein n=1 Tax=Brassicogethes aeneus TaxID=1431903 RepID=A0A9P0AZW4_BRAAE|nr:unnamed protein product [Brassicogethes aeneus]
MECPNCEKTIGKKGYKIQCSGFCELWFHLSTTCTGLSKENIEKAKANKLKWKCKTCSKLPQKVPVRDISSDHDDETSSLDEECDDTNNPKLDPKFVGSQKTKSKNSNKLVQSCFKKSKKDINISDLYNLITKKFSDMEEYLSFNNETVEK